MKLKTSLLKLITFLFGALTLGSCSTPKNISYFQDMSSTPVIESMKSNPIRVEPSDKISIVVKTKDAKISNLFNLNVYTTRSGQNLAGNTGSNTLQDNAPIGDAMSYYTVDSQGDIDFPILGKLHIAGMTRSEISDFIKKEIIKRELAKDPVVTVEFLNTGINILGEVSKPGRYDINKDRISVLEAIAIAGDLTIDGKRENIKVVRLEGDQIKSYNIDLTNMQKIAESPGFWLHQNDIIYVEPNSKKKNSSTVNGNNTLNASFWMSVASVLSSMVTTLTLFSTK